MSEKNIVKHHENRSSIIVNRTGGGYRVVLIDSYFEIEKEVFVDSLELANFFSEKWLGLKDEIF